LAIGNNGPCNLHTLSIIAHAADEWSGQSSMCREENGVGNSMKNTRTKIIDSQVMPKD